MTCLANPELKPAAPRNLGGQMSVTRSAVWPDFFNSGADSFARPALDQAHEFKLDEQDHDNCGDKEHFYGFAERSAANPRVSGRGRTVKSICRAGRFGYRLHSLNIRQRLKYDRSGFTEPT